MFGFLVTYVIVYKKLFKFITKKKHYKESFGNFEVLFGCFRQVSAVETERFLLSQLAESPQK
ncbi:hypothetical protein EEK90_06620 [Muribaculaceae bacterium Isolate-036 (Harlan)]|nr:hypothetical protein EEK90_06620 [Muribaculaceae bacterium Isolate-036 (Harlan)]